ncbi:hypothetical protein, partial [Pseudomonas asiatica]|uniref:hypothetical protein n=1 Tax=Pseudomonas asiatica TaxID=2219225 RepID=UPI003458F435
TDKACLLLVPASSQHKAAPTKDASDEAIFVLCNFPHIQRQLEASAVPVKAGAPAKQTTRALFKSCKPAMRSMHETNDLQVVQPSLA